MESMLTAFNFPNISSSFNNNNNKPNKTDFSEEPVIRNRACCHMIQHFRKCPPADSTYRECASKPIARIYIKRSTIKRKYVWIFCAVSVKRLIRLGIYYSIYHFNNHFVDFVFCILFRWHFHLPTLCILFHGHFDLVYKTS